MTSFNPFELAASPLSAPPSTLATAERCVDMQVEALLQAEQDLNAIRVRQGLPPVASRVVSSSAPSVLRDPALLAQAIVNAGKKRRGELQD